MFGGSVCAGADLLPPAGEGWRSLAEVRDGNAPPLGKPPARGSQGYPQRLSPLPLTLLRRTASGSEKRSSSMRPCTPTPSAPSATGRQSQKSQKSQACPKAGPNRSRHRYADPRAHGGPLHRSALKRLFLFHRARRILFLGKTKKRMGGASPAGAEAFSIPAPFHRSHKTTSAAASFCGRHRCHFHRSPWTIPLPDLRRRQRLPCAGIRCPGP